MSNTTQSDSHLTGDPGSATDADLVTALCGLASRIASVPRDPNGSQANGLHQMRHDLDQVRAAALRRMGAEADGSDALRLATSGPALFSSQPQRWAVARLDDGSEVRMRACGDRVEIRTWDSTESCNPPALDVERIGPHVIDVRVPGSPADAAESDVYVVTTPRGMTESLTEQTVDTLVSLGLIEHERDDYVLETGDGRGVGPVHHFYREVR